MCIITVSRGTSVGARRVAEAAAEQLEIPCVSREIVVEAAKSLGMSDESMAELLARPPRVFERVSGERDSYVLAVRAALLQQAAEGSFVYHGNAGHLLLADVPTVLRVRVVAPMEMRIASVMEHLDLERKSAVRYITKVDKQREAWTHFLYRVDWQDPSLYDLIVNLEHIDTAEASRLVTEVAALERFQRTDEVDGNIADLALSSRVHSTLGVTRAADLHINARSGVVEISGTAVFQSVRDTMVEAARAVPGVVEVRWDVTTTSGFRLFAGGRRERGSSR